MTQAPAAPFLERFIEAFQAGDPFAARKQLEADNVGRLQALYADIARGDFQAFADALAEDAELEIVGGPSIPFCGRWRGRDALFQAVRSNFAMIEEQRPEILSIVAQGDSVVMCCRERGRYRASGQTYDVYWVLFVTYRDGKIVHAREVCADANTPAV
jgi:uncharacterized protein